MYQQDGHALFPRRQQGWGVFWNKIRASPFIIGCLIGAISCAGLPREAGAVHHRAVSTSSAATTMTTTGAAGALQTAVNDYETVQTEIGNAIFGSEVDTGEYFVLDAFPDKQYAVHGHGIEDRKVRFGIVAVLPLDINDTPLALQEGAAMSYVIGSLVGDAGAIAVSGVAAKIKDDAGVMRVFLFPMTIADSAMVADMASMRPYRYSTPSSIIGGTPDNARDPALDPNCVLGTAQEICICLAQRALDNCLKDAGLTNLVCLGICVGLLAPALAACAPTIVVPLIGPISCYAAVLVAFVVCSSGCAALLLINLHSCTNAFRLALRGCGIIIYEV